MCGYDICSAHRNGWLWLLFLFLLFCFFFVLGWGITTQTVPVRSNFHHDQVTITHSCHVKGESCFFFFMVKPLKTVNCHISMFNHVVMTHVNLIERSYLKQEAAVNAGRNCGAHS